MNTAVMPSLILNVLQGFFFGSGKAHVVTGVALIILAGIAWSLWRMDRRLTGLERDATDSPS